MKNFLDETWSYCNTFATKNEDKILVNFSLVFSSKFLQFVLQKKLILALKSKWERLEVNFPFERQYGVILQNYIPYLAEKCKFYSNFQFSNKTRFGSVNTSKNIPIYGPYVKIAFFSEFKIFSLIYEVIITEFFVVYFKFIFLQ